MNLDLMRRCALWVQSTYGDRSLFDRRNRVARFVEEAVELCQAEGLGKDIVDKIVERAYSRPKGEVEQEVAGAYFTLLAYCYAAGITAPEKLCEEELERVSAIDPEHFRAKQREKFAAGTDLVAPV